MTGLEKYRKYGSLADVGTNLTQLKPNKVHEILQRAKEVGVDKMIILGTCVTSSTDAMRMANNKNYLSHGVELFFTAGVHPYESKSWDSSSKDLLRRCLKDKRCVAVGECGLDYHNQVSPIEVQKWVLDCQLKLASEFNLPLYLHERAFSGNDAQRDLLEALSCYPALCYQSIIHCFDSTPEALEKYLSLHMRISISGLVGSTRKGERLRNTLKTVRPPLSSIMIESDTPYLRPDNLPATFTLKGSEPAMLPLIIDMVAECLQEDPEVVAATTSKTALSFFCLDKAFSEPAALKPHSLQTGQATQNHCPVNAPRIILPLALAKLCRTLRSASIDCLLLSHDDIASLLTIGQKEDRVVLLKPEVKLPSHLCVEQPLFRLKCLNPGTQFKEVIKEFDIKLTKEDFELHRRCGVCNKCVWMEDTPDKAEGYVEDSTRLMFSVLMRCQFCNRVYWPQNDYDTCLNNLFALLKTPHNDSDEGKKQADYVVRQATQQQRSNCLMWNGKAGSCTEGNRCEWRHSSKIVDEVHVIVTHNIYGVLLMKGKRSGGPLWEVPKGRLESSDPPLQVALGVIKKELGMDVPPARVHQATDSLTGKALSSGRRKYFCLYLNENDSSRNLMWTRPADSGEPFWLASSRPFCLVSDYAQAARVVKKGYRGDVDGANALKKFCPLNIAKRADRSADVKVRMLDASSDLMNFATASLEEEAEAKLTGMIKKLGEKGVRCGMNRALWETKAPIAKLQCTTRQVMSSNAAKVQSEILLKWAEQERCSTPPEALQVLQAIRGSSAELWGAEVESVDLFGSTVTGIATAGGDVDVCLRLKSMLCLGMKHAVEGKEREKECEALVQLSKHLVSQGILTETDTILSARVPVITGTIAGRKTDITLRYLGVMNTELLVSYFTRYEWLVPVCFVVKNLAVWCGVKGSDVGLFSSYGLVLMVLYCCMKKGLVSKEDLPRDNNKCDVAHVLEMFLAYYGWEHSYTQEAVCIQNLCMAKKDVDLPKTPMMLLDPLEPDVNLCRTMKDAQLDDVVRRFKLAHYTLATSTLAKQLTNGLMLD